MAMHGHMPRIFHCFRLRKWCYVEELLIDIFHASKRTAENPLALPNMVCLKRNIDYCRRSLIGFKCMSCVVILVLFMHPLFVCLFIVGCFLGKLGEPRPFL